jgi:hypothetical protein
VGQPHKYYFECKNAPYEEISLEKYRQMAKLKDKEVGNVKSTEEREKLVINILYSFGKRWPIFRTNSIVRTYPSRSWTPPQALGNSPNLNPSFRIPSTRKFPDLIPRIASSGRGGPSSTGILRIWIFLP